jgi:hypothetical protein
MFGITADLVEMCQLDKYLKKEKKGDIASQPVYKRK